MTFRPDPKPNFLAEKVQKKAQQQRDKTNAMRSHNFFYKSLWNSRPHVCYECEAPLLFYDKRFCHHLIPKRFQPKYSISLDSTDNGCLACETCHDQVVLNIDKVPKIKALTEKAYQYFEKFRIKCVR